MPVYKLVDSKFIEVEDPLGQGEGDVATLCDQAGYACAAASMVGDEIGAGVTLYQRVEMPRFYIDLMGVNSTLAFVVADDFPSLVLTLKELHPLLTLIGLDQVATGRALAALPSQPPPG